MTLPPPPATASSVEAPAAAASAGPGPAHAAADAATVMRALAQPPPTTTAFAEARFSPLLDRPLVISGTLAWLGGDHLQRMVSAPYVETTNISGGDVSVTRAGRGTRHFALTRAPALQALLKSMAAVLSGDPRQLEGLFDLRLDGNRASWTLTLTPATPELREKLAHIRLDGAGTTLACIDIIETDGNASVDLLGPLAARMPASPTRAELTTLCRGSGQ
ncbi:MAG TPA: LolA-related protein [Rhodanobacteraceae bacterium]|nr:LolA-related protein [Rhodanobacteraceae bacterium]